MNGCLKPEHTALAQTFWLFAQRSLAARPGTVALETDTQYTRSGSQMDGEVKDSKG
jgi:hypothetical protein